VGVLISRNLGTNFAINFSLKPISRGAFKSEAPEIGFYKVLKMKGFTLSELLIVIVIISILALLSIGSVFRARQIAAFSVSEATARQFFTAFELGVSQVLESFGVVNLSNLNLTSQQDISSNDILRTLLWGFSLPNRVTINFSLDLGCSSNSCLLASAVVDHYQACKFLIANRYGDGEEVRLSLPKPNC
jgi:prepilin-type N-terminal cleavage/methylation domain-containing protein